jgi:predicted Co/Zn/Cd cation transporter (cation efflux family)
LTPRTPGKGQQKVDRLRSVNKDSKEFRSLPADKYMAMVGRASTSEMYFNMPYEDWLYYI